MDVTYYVALPFVAADDSVAAGEAVECFQPERRRDARRSAVPQARPSARSPSAGPGIPPPATSATRRSSAPDDLSAL
jgi:hypothetical protein